MRVIYRFASSLLLLSLFQARNLFFLCSAFASALRKQQTTISLSSWVIYFHPITSNHKMIRRIFAVCFHFMLFSPPHRNDFSHYWRCLIDWLKESSRWCCCCYISAELFSIAELQIHLRQKHFTSKQKAFPPLGCDFRLKSISITVHCDFNILSIVVFSALPLPPQCSDIIFCIESSDKITSSTTS